MEMDKFLSELRDAIEEDQEFREATNQGPKTREDILAMIQFDTGAPVRYMDEPSHALAIAGLAYRLWAKDYS
jgi:hypothetical protein